MCLSELYRCLFGCKQENCLWFSFPHSSLRLKECIFFSICSVFKRHAGGSQPISAHTTSKWRQWKQSTHISRQVLAHYVRVLFFFFSFLKNNCKNDFSQLKLHNLFFFVPWLSSRHNVENKARSPFYTSKTGLSYVKYRVFEILKHYLSSTPFAIASF